MSRGMEVALADLAATQWGLVTTGQAQAAGVSRTHLNRLAVAGVLVRLTHGVYAMRTSAGDDLLDLRCAWLTLDPFRLAAERLADPGPPAVVSHASAAHLYGYGDLLADRHEFTVPTRKQTRRVELRLHRGDLAAGDVTVHRGLPVTTPGRTVLDLLTTHHDGEHVADVLAAAVRAHQVDLDDLGPRLAPFASRFGLPRRDGAAVLSHLLQLGGVADEVDAAALAVSARAVSVSINDYVAGLVATLAEAKILEGLAALSEAVQHQMEPAAAALAALAAAQTTTFKTSQLLANVQMPSIPLTQLQQISDGLLPIQSQLAQAAQQVQLNPVLRAEIEHLRSPQMQAQLAAVRRATQS